MKNQRLARFLVAAGLLIPVSGLAADDAALFRVFLKDGTTLVSYGEFARVGDRVVFSMPLGAPGADPALHLVNIGSDRVDWDRTNRYAESARSAQYVATRAERDYTALSNEVARALNDVTRVPDAAKRLALVENARKALAEWPRAHYNYRAAEVHQMLTMLDDAIADLRASSGIGTFDLRLTSYAADPPTPLEPLLPPPTPKESIEQALFTAKVAESAAERESLLNAAIVALDRNGTDLPADWTTTTRATTKAELENELRIDRAYQGWSSRVMGRVEQRARQADVRGIQQVLAAVIPRGDVVLGVKRPDAVNALIAAVQSQLDVARQLRLERDRWAIRAPEFHRYWTAITEPVDLFAVFTRMKPALEDIKSLAGSTPASLAATDRAMRAIVRRAATIVPPEEFRAAHALIVSAAQLANNAATIRREATLSGSIPRAWDASSAAAGALMLSARARSEIQALLRPPELR